MNDDYNLQFTRKHVGLLSRQRLQQHDGEGKSQQELFAYYLLLKAANMSEVIGIKKTTKKNTEIRTKVKTVKEKKCRRLFKL